MTQMHTKARRGFSRRFIIGATLAGLALSAVAATEVYYRWVTLRLTSGEEKQMQAIDNGDDTLTLVGKDGSTQTAHVIPDGAIDFDTLSTDVQAELMDQVSAGEAEFALVGGTVVDENGKEIAVTYDLSDPDDQKPSDDDGDDKP